MPTMTLKITVRICERSPYLALCSTLKSLRKAHKSLKLNLSTLIANFYRTAQGLTVFAPSSLNACSVGEAKFA